MRISLAEFIGPAPLFDLRGYTDCAVSGSKPCRVKVGPRRFLNIDVYPEQFKCDLWAVADGQVIYLAGQDIPEQWDGNGVRYFDAEAFLREHLGSSSPCSSNCYRSLKENDYGSTTFLATDYGAATSSTGRQGTYSKLFFAPGTLTLCGQNVRTIRWSSTEGNNSARGTVLRPLVEAALNGAHQLGVSDVKAQLPMLHKAGGLDFDVLRIETDSGTYSIHGSRSSSQLFAHLSDGEEASCRTTSAGLPEALEALLFLLQCSTKEKLNNQLAKMQMLDMVVRDW